MSRAADLLLSPWAMTSMTKQPPADIEQLWTTPDGTTCILATCETPPMYSITVVRDAVVLRERRVYGRATARMLAAGWNELAARGL